MDKKSPIILALIVLSTVTAVGWWNATQAPTPENISHDNTYPYDNTYVWTEIFGGYEAYLDKRIYASPMSGISMVPTINNGDTVLWVSVENMADLKENDIIIFKHPTYPDVDNIAHRIVEIVSVDGGYQFRTKGDNSSEPDQHPVPEANVHGLVIGVVYQRGS